jgi:energy-coupling factor transporter ATP-binding protein EcfA2
MKKLILDLEHCYGIKKLQAEFDFETHGDVFTIYAPNGVMKTSLANTFRDISKKTTTSDRIWKENQTQRIIRDENGSDLAPESVFVIEPYNEGYRSDRISTLLVNDELRKRYDAIHKEINEKAELLIGELKMPTGLKKGIREEFSVSITHDPDDFFRALGRVKNEVENDPETPLGNVVYADVFNPKVEPVLNDPDFISKIEEYIQQYDELVSKSTFFRKGIFTHNNAADIAKNLNANGFFKADHSVYLRINGEKTEVTSLKDLEAAIQSEKDLILTDDSLKSAFEAIDKQLQKNADLKKFRVCLEENQVVLGELSNPARLRQKLWVQYLIRSKTAYVNLLSSFNDGKDQIAEIVSEAKAERTKWSEVISIFNERFSVPFVVRIDNQEDVILKSDAPSICFDFLENPDDRTSTTAPIDEADLKRVLSNGECRALYILNIIFEVEARKTAGQHTLFIVDDIADSFDYKNKYAIIEYLSEVSAEDGFQQLILSHNFDFYRTVSSRLNLKRQNRILASKENGTIALYPEIYQRSSPFSHWRQNLTQNPMLIASIPFLRNLAEFSGDEASYTKLTSLLHVKSDTAQFSVANLEALIKSILHDQATLSLPDSTLIVKDLVYQVASSIAADPTEAATLEDKVTLSIAIRLKAEEFMITKINDEPFWHGISSNQTIALIKRFKSDFPTEKNIIQLFEQVNLMTPENIHLNSFMYEPILDLSAHHLKRLFTKVNEL